MKIGGAYNICWNLLGTGAEQFKVKAMTICTGSGGLGGINSMLECSNGGGSFRTVFENQPSAGCFQWRVPAIVPFTYELEVRADSVQSGKWFRKDIGIRIEN